MSNENSTTNAPRKKNKTGLQRVSSGRYRAFMCLTYLEELQIKLVLMHHSNQIRIYAYALHDKDTFEEDIVDKDSGEVVHRKGDLKEPHYHVLLLLHNNCTMSAIRRWFYGWKDSDGKEINTLVQVSRDKYASFDYLTHNTPDCIRDGKYLYPDSIVECNDIKHFKGHCSADFDSATLMMIDFCKGVPYQQMIYKYGRDFIMNFEKLRYLATEMYFHKGFNPVDYDNSHPNVMFTSEFNEETGEYSVHPDYTESDISQRDLEF